MQPFYGNFYLHMKMHIDETSVQPFQARGARIYLAAPSLSTNTVVGMGVPLVGLAAGKAYWYIST